MLKNWLYKLFILFPLWAVSCGGGGSDIPGSDANVLPGGGTETGNPAAGKFLFLSYESSELTASSSLATLKDGFKATAALMVVRSMRIEENSQCPSLFLPEGLMVIDLLREPSPDEEQGGQDHKNTHCRPVFIFELGPLQAGEEVNLAPEGQQMVGKSFLLKIEREGQEAIQFQAANESTMRFTSPEEWINPERGENLIFGMNRDLWLEGVEVQNFSGIVTEQDAPDVLDRLIRNRIRSMGLFRDQNGNQKLDWEEAQNPIATPVLE